MNLSWKFLSVLITLIIAVVLILPTVFMSIDNTKEPELWPHKKINLGLDLQGGIHLVLEVKIEEAVESAVERLTNEIRSQLKKEHVRNIGVKTVDKVKISIKIKEKSNFEKFDEILSDNYRDLEILNSSVEKDIKTYTVAYTREEEVKIKNLAVRQSLEKIRNRVDEFGVSEPDIRVQGERRILIQLPGMADAQRAKEILGKTAKLEFRLVDEKHSLADALRGSIPPGSEVLYKYDGVNESGESIKTPYLIKKRKPVTGDSLTDARVQVNSQENEYYVQIKFDKKGGRAFERLTEANVGRRLAIILDKKVYSAPVINDRIPAGSPTMITGRFTVEEAQDLAIILRAGALPATVEIIEERIVGPTLGSDSINQGLKSMLIGFLIVIVFMIIYYKGSGLIADFALFLNIILICGALAAFQATLTLPGIAGIILVIGMAVDANVLIFERIREELALGRTAVAAVEAGFDRATLTILDANITTLIAALVLFQFGTGAIRGFALTLSLGVLASMFTALVVSKMIFEFLLKRKNIKNLSI